MSLFGLLATILTRPSSRLGSTVRRFADRSMLLDGTSRPATSCHRNQNDWVLTGISTRSSGNQGAGLRFLKQWVSTASTSPQHRVEVPALHRGLSHLSATGICRLFQRAGIGIHPKAYPAATTGLIFCATFRHRHQTTLESIAGGHYRPNVLRQFQAQASNYTRKHSWRPLQA
jgi:hypothetical protein